MNIRLIKDWLPPALLRLLLPWFGKTIRFRGHFGSYAEASVHSTGYDAAEILAQVQQAALAVKMGTAVAERDGVLLDQASIPYPVLAELLFVAAHANGRLAVCDFGGSLGSVYRACAAFLDDLPAVRWGVVEQPLFIAAGREHFADQTLGFYYDLDECIATLQPQVLLLSSVLQYLDDPLAFLASANDGPWRSIVIDRTPFTKEDLSFVTVQSVPAQWVKSSYPSWFFSAAQVLATLPNYEVISEFPASDGRIGYGPLCADYRGLILRRRVV